MASLLSREAESLMIQIGYKKSMLVEQNVDT